MNYTSHCPSCQCRTIETCTRCGHPITRDEMEDAWRSGDKSFFHGTCPDSPEP